MPLGDGPAAYEADDVRRREGVVLSASSAVITTSEWSRRRLIELYALPAHRVHAAHPGGQSHGLASGTATGSALLCVAAVAHHKGHDLLLDALELISDLSWHCACLGRLDCEPAFVEALRLRALDLELADRVS